MRCARASTSTAVWPPWSNGPGSGFAGRLGYVAADFEGAGGYEETLRRTDGGRRAAEQPALLPVDRAGASSPGSRRDPRNRGLMSSTPRLRPPCGREALRHGPRERPRAARPRCAPSSPRTTSTGSTTTWARRPCRTCFVVRFANAHLRASLESALRRQRPDHRLPRTSASGAAAATTTTAVRCATSCRTTCSRCSRSWRWSRRRPLRRGRSGTRR